MDGPTEIDLATILARFNHSSPEALVASIASEFLRLHQSYAALASRVVAMEMLQMTIDRVAAEAPGMLVLDLPDSTEVDAAFSFTRAQGFYQLEWGDGRRPYRWTGPDPQFSFELFVRRDVPLRFVLQFLRSHAPVTSGFRCFVDGKESPCELIDVAGAYQLQGVIPERSSPGGSLLSFVCPIMQSPFEAGTADDRRRLGIAFERLKIEPTSQRQPQSSSEVSASAPVTADVLSPLEARPPTAEALLSARGETLSSPSNPVPRRSE